MAYTNELITLAKRHNFDKEKMRNDLERMFEKGMLFYVFKEFIRRFTEEKNAEQVIYSVIDGIVASNDFPSAMKTGILTDEQVDKINEVMTEVQEYYRGMLTDL